MNNQEKDTNVSYGFVKPTALQWGYIIAVVALTVVICLPAVYTVLWNNLSISIWITLAFNFLLPVIAMARAVAQKKKDLAKK